MTSSSSTATPRPHTMKVIEPHRHSTDTIPHVHVQTAAASSREVTRSKGVNMINDDDASSSSDMRSQTCVEFLHIMKEFSESSCDVNETVQRVDSLVNQDEQLLRLFPLSRVQEEAAAGAGDGRVNYTVDTTEEDETSTTMDTTHDELQRWMDLDFTDLDHHMDVFDFQSPEPVTMTEFLTTTSCKRKNPMRLVPLNMMNSMTSAGGRTDTTEVCFQQTTTDGTTTKCMRRQGTTTLSQQFLTGDVNESRLNTNKSYTTVLVEDDDNDLDLVLDRTALSSGSPLKRTKLSQAVSTQGLQVSVSMDTESKAETDDESKADEDEEGNVWGMETDHYEHDLLSSIDHAVLCDRENRFLQWDLEAAQHYQLQEPWMLQANNLNRNAMTSVGMAGRTAIGVSVASNSAISGLTAIQTQRSLQKANDKTMALSPISSKSPSNVDIVEDWNSLDFGTFQNRTVSHILSSCLHKRKLHHPYKNQVQLVNFNVPSSGEFSNLAPGPHAHQLGGSLATSLAFGGQQHGFDGTDGSSMSGYVPLFATRHENDHGSSKYPGKGEKKVLKKREERKRLMTLKMQETFADLEGTFTEQDLDVKGIVGPGASLSKMALSKLENLPLPDLMNLPQDLRELKRKIEATEHKVEGTKHRHRKGGPCPRCQVQNQLRAAKRAYHKRAVAHKKLPHVVVNAVNGEAQEAANAQAAAAATLELANNVTEATKAVIGVGAKKGMNGSIAATAACGNGSNGKARTAMTNVVNLSPGVLKQVQRSAPSFVSSPSGSLCSTSSVATTGTVGSTSGSSSSSTCGGVSPPPSLSIQARGVRGPCGKASSPSAAMPFSSPSSASVSPTSASNPSSPEPTSRQLQHVAVSSG